MSKRLQPIHWQTTWIDVMHTVHIMYKHRSRVHFYIVITARIQCTHDRLKLLNLNWIAHPNSVTLGFMCGGGGLFPLDIAYVFLNVRVRLWMYLRERIWKPPQICQWATCSAHTPTTSKLVKKRLYEIANNSLLNPHKRIRSCYNTRNT